MWSLPVFVALVAGAALIGGSFRPGLWYAALSKPAWTPPGWLFGPVWSALYLCIAISGWLSWRAASGRIGAALVFWALQLILNAVWSWLFFGLHRPDLALADIVLLWCAIAAYIAAAAPRTRWGAALFIPYALWVSLAAALNFAIWRLNRPVG